MASHAEVFRAMYVYLLNEELHRLCKEYCFGCEMNHPNIWYHDCYSMMPEEKWFTFKGAAIRHLQEEKTRNILNKGLKALHPHYEFDLATVHQEQWVYSLWLEYYYGDEVTENILYQIWK